MLVTLEGIVTDVRPLQLSNAANPMLFTAEPISTSIGYLIQDGGKLFISPAAASDELSIDPSIK